MYLRHTVRYGCLNLDTNPYLGIILKPSGYRMVYLHLGSQAYLIMQPHCVGAYARKLNGGFPLSCWIPKHCCRVPSVLGSWGNRSKTFTTIVESGVESYIKFLTLS